MIPSNVIDDEELIALRKENWKLEQVLRAMMRLRNEIIPANELFAIFKEANDAISSSSKLRSEYAEKRIIQSDSPSEENTKLELWSNDVSSETGQPPT